VGSRSWRPQRQPDAACSAATTAART
jgi:hypothetical protein